MTEPLARLCGAVPIEDVTHRSVARIRRELPAYAVIDPAEHLETVRHQQRNQLAALARGEVLSRAALAEAEELARGRARQGIDIEVLIGAYHLGDQELWQAVLSAAGDGTTDVLPRVASLMFASLHALSTALTAAHAEASQALQVRRITASQRLLELLLSGSDVEEARLHSRALGLDPDGEFVGVAWSDPRHAGTAVPRRFMRGLEDAGIAFAVGQVAAENLLVCQGSGPDTVERVVVATLPSGRAGIGLTRPGLAGATTSLGDARLAAAAVPFAGTGTDAGAEPVGVRAARLERSWPDACVFRELDRLDVLLAPVRAVARAHPHLAAAVLAFARADMQLTRAAQLLHLHPNSLSYRLDRWGALTGWNPRTFDGVRRSRLAISSLAERGGAGVEVLDQPEP